MDEETEVFEQQLPLDNAGARLRRAREQAGISIEQLAAETRIPQRHIETLETGEYGRLPSRTYAIGFSRSYAKVVGLSESEIASQVRAELARASGERRVAGQKFEPGDPARVPSRGLAWLTAAAAVLLLVGGFSFYRSYFAPGVGPAPLVDPAQEAVTATAARPGAEPSPTGEPRGEVVFTALEDGVWVKFYDAAGAQLMQKQMALNERYTVPANAEGPQVWTGRPDALRITIGGRPVPKLADSEQIVRDVPVTADALLARSTRVSAPTGNPTT